MTTKEFLLSLPDVWCFESASHPKNPTDISGEVKSNWGETLSLISLKDATKAFDKTKHANFGILLKASLAEQEPIVVIDFDKLTEEQLRNIQEGTFEFRIPFPILGYYAEYSKSGKGLHIICLVDVDIWKQLPAHICDIRQEYHHYYEDKGRIEYFTNHSNRFIVCTGKTVHITFTVSDTLHPLFSYTDPTDAPELDLRSLDFLPVTTELISSKDLWGIIQPYMEPLFSTGIDDRGLRRVDNTASGDVFALTCRLVRFTQNYKQISAILRSSYVFKNSSWGNPDIPDGQGKRYQSTKWDHPFKSSSDPTAQTIGEHTFHRAYAYIKSLDAFITNFFAPVPEAIDTPIQEESLTQRIQKEYDTYRVTLWGTQKSPAKIQLNAAAFVKYLQQSEYNYTDLHKPYLNTLEPANLCKDLIQINKHLGIRYLEDWYVYDYLNKYYKLLDDAEVTGVYTQLLSNLFPNANANFFTSTVKLLKTLLLNKCVHDNSIREHAGYPALEFNSWLNKDEYKNDICIAVSNGILNITKKTIIPKCPEFFAINQVPLTISEEDLQSPPQPKRWLQFLEEEFGEDNESKEALQRFMGYCLSPINPEGKGLFVLGTTKAGKSTMLWILRKLFPSQFKNVTLQDMQSDFCFAGISTTRVFACSELGRALRADMAKIEPKLKTLLSPSDTVRENEKFKRAIEVVPKCKTILVGNEMPPFSDEGQAISERFIYINFQTSFAGREDPQFIPKLEQELPAIFLWIIKGYEMWYEDYYIKGKSTGLLQPKSGLSTQEQLIEGAKSSVQKFFEDACYIPSIHEESPHFWTPVQKLREFYKLYCNEIGQHPVSEYKFTQLGKPAMHILYTKKLKEDDVADRLLEEMYYGIHKTDKKSQRCFRIVYKGFDSTEDIQELD